MSQLVGELADFYAHYRSVLPAEYKWEDEKDRWHELVYCILFELGGQDETASRHVVSGLSALNLLDVGNLASAVRDGGTIDPKNRAVEDLVRLLTHNGVEKAQARLVAETVCQAAKEIATRYGKLQHFFRRHGTAMLEELAQAFPMSGVATATKQRILTSWLQSLFELPIPMANRYVAAFCEETGCSVKDLVEAADALDVNVAVVDDLIRLHMIDVDEPKSLSGEGAATAHAAR